MFVSGSVLVRAQIYKGRLSNKWFCHIDTGSVFSSETWKCNSWEEAVERALKELREEEEDENRSTATANG